MTTVRINLQLQERMYFTNSPILLKFWIHFASQEPISSANPEMMFRWEIDTEWGTISNETSIQIRLGENITPIPAKNNNINNTRG